MRLFKAVGVRRPLDSKFKIDMILDFLLRNGIMLDRFIDSYIRESITERFVLQYYETHSTYKALLYASKQNIGIKVHLNTGCKKKGAFPRQRKKVNPPQKKVRKNIDIFKKEGETHKPRLSELIEESRASLGTKKPSQWLKLVSVPMGGQNKKY